MLTRRFRGLSDLASKKNVVGIILIVNAFVWYYTVLSSLQSTNPSILVWIVHFSALILSALAGSSLGKRLERPKFLILWMITGVVSSSLLFALTSESVFLVSLISLFLGASLGFGMPACMSYFSDGMAVESRGRVSGVAMLASGIGIGAFGLALEIDLFFVGIILAIWRFSSLLVFLWAKDFRRIEQNENEPSYKQVFGQRSFVLYFVPWVMFSLVNYLASPIVPSNISGLGLVQTISVGAAAVLGGSFADSLGRKRIAIAGFALLGLGAAVLGFSNGLPEIPYPVFYFNAIIDGVAWGFLLVLFVLTLWGDLSCRSSSDKYYALGVMPFFVSKLLEITVGQQIPLGVTATTSLFSFTAFFLFLAILPLVYAPETLPEKVMKDRDLKSYVEKAKKKVQKESTKTQEKEEKEQGENESCELELEVRQDDEKALELAEKYY